MNISELRELFTQQLGASDFDRAISDMASVLSVGAGIACVSGLQDCMAGELLEFADGTLGMALNLENNTAGVGLFASSIDVKLHEGTVVRTSRHVVQIPVGVGYCGRIINALGEPVDGAGSLPSMTDMRCLESPAPDIMSRVSVHEPFATGITAIDRQTGKSTITIDSIIN